MVNFMFRGAIAFGVFVGALIMLPVGLLGAALISLGSFFLLGRLFK